jgi:threonine dehydratase
MQPPTIDDVRDAAEVVHRHLPRTLLYDWPLLVRRLGFSFHLKHENHQPHGAFKIRGGVNLVRRLSDDERRRGIIGCSTGNHGQSLAFAARRFGVDCTIVVPVENNPDKVASIRALGATIVEHGRDFDEAKLHCEQLAAERGLRYVHSANEPLLIAGVGTMALEVFDVLPSPDVLLVPIGLGSGVCGSAIVAAALSPQTRVIGVQATGASAVAESWRQGRTIANERVETFAEGLATRAPAELTLAIMRRLMHDVVLVTDDELRQAMRWIISDTHNLPEPAGAASTAAAWKLREQLAGQTVVGILSGGNCDTRLLGELFAGPLSSAS